MSGISAIKRAPNGIPRWSFTINRQSEQARGLSVWYPLDNPGVGARDLVRNVISPITNSGGFAVRPDGLNALISTDSGQTQINTNLAGPAANSDISITCWIKRTSFASNADVAAGAFGGSFALWIGAIGTTYYFSSGASNATASGSDGEWHLLSGVRSSSGTTSLYIDGLAAGSGSDNSNIGGTWYISTFGLLDYFFDGYLNDVRIYSRALSASEVWALYDPATRYELFEPVRSRTYLKAGAANVSRTSDFNIAIGAV